MNTSIKSLIRISLKLVWGAVISTTSKSTVTVILTITGCFFVNLQFAKFIMKLCARVCVYAFKIFQTAKPIAKQFTEKLSIGSEHVILIGLEKELGYFGYWLPSSD